MENYSWLMNYGELVGKSHAPRKLPCQDKTLCMQKNGVTVAVLSDGCGSSDMSEVGSDITTKVLCELFTTRFDELYCPVNRDAIFGVRKKIIDTIGQAFETYIENNGKIFDECKDNHKEQYQEYLKKHSEKSYLLSCLNATVLFVAEKDHKYIIGQIGDGIIGAVIGNKLKIIMEENKDGEINGTFYPTNIYSFAKEDSNWYASSHFKLKELTSGDINGFILISDGVDAFVDERVPFQKKFAKGVNKLFQSTVKAKTLEERQKILNTVYLPRLVEMSRAQDDCSVALLIKPNYKIDPDNGYVVKEYPRPVIITPVEIEKEEDSNIKEAESAEKAADESLKKIDKLAAKLNEFISKAEAAEFIENAKKLLSNPDSLSDLLNFYYLVLSKIDKDSYYDMDSEPVDEIGCNQVYVLDNSIRREGTKLVRKGNDGKEKID